MSEAAAIPGETADWKLPPAPYPGLRSFFKDDWPIFFGRETTILYLMRTLHQKGFIVIHGGSGCGKSSLVRAGVQAQLESESARVGRRWLTTHMNPGASPLQNLAHALAKRGEDEPPPERVQKIRQALYCGDDAAPMLAERLELEPDQRLCLLVDQFEEIFRFGSEFSLEEAQLFVEALIGCEAHRVEGLSIIVTMRSEFLGVCGRFKGLIEAINRTQYLLPYMDRAALQRAIREPAKLYDLHISEAFADHLVADVGGEPDQLPLIQHGLRRLWLSLQKKKKVAGASAVSVQEGGWLALPKAGSSAWTLDLGKPDKDKPPLRLAKLLADHADEVLNAVAPESDQKLRSTVEYLFRALSHTNTEGYAVRRPQRLKSLVEATGDRERLLRVIDAYLAPDVSFLVRSKSEKGPDDDVIDISHEAVLRCWPKLADRKPDETGKAGWLRQEFEDGLRWRGLAMHANRFKTKKQGPIDLGSTNEQWEWFQEISKRPGWARRYLIDPEGKPLATEESEWIAVKDLIAASQSRLETWQADTEAKARAEEQRKSLKKRVIQGTILSAAVAVLGVFAYQLSVIVDQQEALVVQQQADIYEKQALLAWQAFESGRSDLSPREANALWLLSVADQPVRDVFIDRLFADGSPFTAAFNAKPELITQALVGFDQQRHKTLLSRVTQEKLLPFDQISVAAINLRLALEDPAWDLHDPLVKMLASADNVILLDEAFMRRWEKALARVPETTASRLASSLELDLQQMRDRKDSSPLPVGIYARALGALPTTLPKRVQGEIFSQLLRAIESEVQTSFAETQNLSALSHGFAALAAELPPDDLTQTIESLIMNLQRLPISHATTSVLDVVFDRLATSLTDQQAAAIVAPVANAMRTFNDPAYPLAGAPLVSILGRLPPSLLRDAVSDLIGMVQDESDPQRILRVLKTAFADFPPDMLQRDKIEAIGPLLTDALQTERDPRRIAFFARLLDQLDIALTPKESTKPASLLWEAFLTETDAHLFREYARGLRSLSSGLSSEKPQRAWELAINRFGARTDLSNQETLSGALGAILVMLPPDQTGTAANQVIATVQKASDPIQMIGILTPGFRSVPARLSADQANEVAPVLARAIDDAKDVEVVAALVTALARLPGEAKANLLPQATDRLITIAGMKGGSHSVESATIIRALGAAAGALPAERASDIALDLVRLLGDATNDVQFKKTLRSVLDKSAITASTGRIDEAYALILGMIVNRGAATSSDASGALSGRSEISRFVDLLVRGQYEQRVLQSEISRVLRATGVGLSDAEIELQTYSILKVIRDSTNNEQLQALSKALAESLKQLTPDQLAKVAEQLLQVIRQSVNSRPLVDALRTGFRPLPAKIPQDQAKPPVQLLLTAIRQTTNNGELRLFGEALLASSNSLSSDEARQVATIAQAVIGRSGDGGIGKLYASILGEASKTLEEPQLASAVQALLYPTISARASERILDIVSTSRGVRPPASGEHWDVARWLAANMPSLDVSRPPVDPCKAVPTLQLCPSGPGAVE